MQPEVLARFLSAARLLNPYATQFRYPGGPLEPETADARHSVTLATEIYQSVLSQLFPDESQ